MILRNCISPVENAVVSRSKLRASVIPVNPKLQGLWELVAEPLHRKIYLYDDHEKLS